MSLKCLFGHQWSGCKCKRCGQTRDEQHNWDLCKGKCKCCGKTQEEQHDWNFCTCRVCGKKRGISLWNADCNLQPIVDECKKKCSVCGNEVEHHDWWDKCVCKKCGRINPNPLHQDDSYHGDWDLIEDTCVEKCSLCGKKRIAKNAKKKFSPYHIEKMEKNIEIISDVHQAEEIIIDKDFHTEYFEYYKEDLAWIFLLTLQSKQVLQRIAKEAKYSRFRWKACKLSGGHVYNNEAVNKCKCTICGFQYHNDQNNICERCNGTITVSPFVTGYPHGTIVFSDGTKETFLGYNGILSGECEFI